MDLKKKVLSGLGWSAGAKYAGQIITWGITIIVIRLLTPEDYGLMAIAGVFINFLMLLNELGLGAAIIQKKDLDDLTLRQIFGVLLIMNLCLFFILLGGAPLIAKFFKEGRIIPIIQTLSIKFLIISFTTIPQSLIIKNLDFKKLFLVDFISTIVGSITTLILALKGLGVWSLIWGNLAMTVVGLVGINIVAPFLRFPLFSFKKIKELIYFGGYVTISRILWFFYTQADVIIIGRIIGKEPLGYYSIAMNLSSIPMDKTSGIINQVTFPAYSSIQEEPKRVGDYFLKGVRLMSMFAFPILWGGACIAPEIVNTLLGGRWGQAIVPMQILSLVIPIRMISNLIAPITMGLGRPDISLFNALLAAVLIPLCILIGSHWGIIGVSLAWVVGFPIVFLKYIFQVAPILGITLKEVLSSMAKPVLSAAIMYIVVAIMRLIIGSDEKSIIQLILFILIGVLVYCAIVFTINRKGCQEVLGVMKT